jgi:restriction endonuclease S subunit
MKFLDLFEPIQKGDFGLTDEAVYKSIQYNETFVPLWGGEQEHTVENRFVSIKGRTKHNEPITIFQGIGVIISLDGSAGRMTFVKNKKFALNHHAGFLRIKGGAENLIDPEFFSLFYEKQLVEASVSEGSKTLTTRQIYEMDFDIPLYGVQKQIMSEMKPVLENKDRINKLLEKIESLKNRVLSYDYLEYQAIEVPVSRILQFQSGNSGLTEEYLYSLIQDKSPRIYRILTGSTDNEIRQYTFKCRHPKNALKDIATLEGKAVIHVVRKGKAGSVAFLDAGNYTATDDAYMLYLREKLPYSVDLRWLMYALKSRFVEYASSSDNGTWNKTTFFKNVTADLPAYSEQLQIVNMYEKIEMIEKKLVTVQLKMNELFGKQLSSPSTEK